MTARQLAGAATIALLFVFCGFEIYHSTGFVRATKKPGSWYNGCICHGDKASPFVNVTISGPESLGVSQIGTYLLRVVRDTNIAAGFNVAAFLGDLMVGDSLEQQILEGELTHTLPKYSAGSDTITWMFQYQAPEVATFDTLYAVGNSVNMNLDPNGDFWNFSDNFIVRVGNPTHVIAVVPPLAAQYHLSQNYPNPFNPSTIIKYQIPVHDFITLKVYDLIGREVASLLEGYVTAGEHEIVFDAEGLPSGLYLYRLTGRDFAETRKMTVLH